MKHLKVKDLPVHIFIILKSFLDIVKGTAGQRTRTSLWYTYQSRTNRKGTRLNIRFT